MNPNVVYNFAMIGLILFAFGLLWVVVKQVRPWIYWIVPITAFLLIGLIYSINFIVDSLTGRVDATLYNYLNQWLRTISYITVILYLIAFITVHRRKK